MALTKADRDYIAAAIVAGIEVALTAKSAPKATATASDHIGPSGKPDGRKAELACGECGRLFRGDGLRSGKATFATATGGLAYHLRETHKATGF